MMADIGNAATTAGEDTAGDAADTVGDFIMDLFWACPKAQAALIACTQVVHAFAQKVQ